MDAKVSANDEVTIPQSCRDALGIGPGTVLVFAAVEGKLMATKRPVVSRIHQWRGRAKLPQGVDVDTYLRECRD